LSCDLELGNPPASVTWVKGQNKEVISEGDKYHMTLGKLEIRDTEEGDEDVYEVIVENKAGQVRSRAKVIVLVSPSLTFEDSLRSSQVLKVGQHLDIEVKVKAKPVAKTRWTKDDLDLEVNEKIKIEERENFTKISLRDTTEGGKFKVMAENEAGQCEHVFEVVVKDRPSPPLNLRPSQTSTSEISLIWDTPVSDGGAPITHYILERRSLNKDIWVKVDETSETSGKATRLTEKHQYEFRVMAENDVGCSEPCYSEIITAKLPHDPPGPPLNLSATEITSMSAILSWEAPATDGGKPVSGYYIEKKSTYNTRFTKVNKTSISDLQMTLSDLEEGQLYVVKVKAENEVGSGEFCEPISFEAKDPYSLPDPPGRPAVTSSYAQAVDLCWEAPPSDGGADSPITS
jgi:titin